MAFGLFGLSSLGSGFVKGMEEADDWKMRKLKLEQEQSQLGGSKAWEKAISDNPSLLGQVFHQAQFPGLGGGQDQPMAPTPGQPSVPTGPTGPQSPVTAQNLPPPQQGPQGQQVAAVGPQPNVFQSPTAAQVGMQPWQGQNPGYQDALALLKQRMAGQPIGPQAMRNIQAGAGGPQLEDGSPAPQPRPQPPPQQAGGGMGGGGAPGGGMQGGGGMQPGGGGGVQPGGGMQGGGGQQGFGGGLDLARVAAAIKQSNPNLKPGELLAALQSANKLLNPESKQQLQMMQMMLARERMSETERHHRATEGPGAGGIDEEALGRLGWTKDAIQARARVWIDTGQMPTNLGTRATAGQIIGAIQQAAGPMMKAMGLDAQDLPQRWAQYGGDKQYQRSAGGFGARVESASNEVEQLIPQALETSKMLPRGQFVPFNRLFNAYRQGTSDPAYNDFIMANFSLINAYTRAMNPTGIPRVNDRLEQHAIGILSEATSQQAYEVQVRRLWKEVQASKKAVAQTREGRTGGDINKPLPGEEGGAGAGGGGQPDPLGMR